MPEAPAADDAASDDEDRMAPDWTGVAEIRPSGDAVVLRTCWRCGEEASVSITNQSPSRDIHLKGAARKPDFIKLSPGTWVWRWQT